MNILSNKVQNILSESNSMLLESPEAIQLINSVNMLGNYTKLEILLKTAHDSKYIASTKQMSEILDFNNYEAMLGKTSADINPKIGGGNLKSWINNIDKITIQQKKINCIEMLNYADGSRIKSSQREAVLNGEMLICSYHSVDKFNSGFMDMILHKRLKRTGTKNGYSFLVNDAFKIGYELIDNLSAYYKEVAYLLMLGLSLQDIADLMDKIHPKDDGTRRNRITIDKVKSVICDRLNLHTNSREELVQYLNDVGYYNFIPESIFNLTFGIYK